MKPRARILVVDDQESARDFMGRSLSEMGHEPVVASSVREALERLNGEPIELVLMDVRMPELDGMEGLKRVRALASPPPVIMVTAYARVEAAVQAMKLGAVDYLRKPVDLDELELVVARALEHQRLLRENIELRERVQGQYRLDNIIGRGPAMNRVFDRIHKIAPAELPVLVVGESGTGKDLVARALHGLSRRADSGFLSINCAAVPESLLESELFGHVRGAFSGAERSRSGYFREADGGTLFLDEIGEMSLAQQAKLLRVIESGEVMPVGSEQVVRVDVRLIVATHRDLEALVREERFREDLLYRIDTVRVELPPLRRRREDIPQLVAHFLENLKGLAQLPPPRISAAAMRELMAYDWPGNVRELEHAIEHAALVAEGELIEPDDLPPRVRASANGRMQSRSWRGVGSYRDARMLFEREFFAELLQRAEGNISRAAELGGVHRATLHQKIKELGLK